MSAYIKMVLKHTRKAQFDGRLNDWETEFVDDVYTQYESGVSLTEKQIKKLEEIFENLE